jgi:hypothetical protein
MWGNTVANQKPCKGNTVVIHIFFLKATKLISQPVQYIKKKTDKGYLKKKSILGKRNKKNVQKKKQKRKKNTWGKATVF